MTSVLSACITGIGFWTRGLPSWDAARSFLEDGKLAELAPARPAPQLLAANERRRAPETVAVALEVALAACRAAGRDPSTLPSVFASTHGDMEITDYMCATLVDQPGTISPTRFHNSVHNAAAGYWTIGAGAMAPATALSAYDATFTMGLLEAMVQLASGSDEVLLVAYDGSAKGPLARISPSEGLLGGALVLARAPQSGAPRVRAQWRPATAPPAQQGALTRICAGNAMLPMLPLFEALALQRRQVTLPAGAGNELAMEIDYD